MRTLATRTGEHRKLRGARTRSCPATRSTECSRDKSNGGAWSLEFVSLHLNLPAREVSQFAQYTRTARQGTHKRHSKFGVLKATDVCGIFCVLPHCQPSA